YLDPETVLARVGAPETSALLVSDELRAVRVELAAGARVDYGRALALRRPLLEAAHREFAQHHRAADTELGRAHRAYRAREGRTLELFALFCALRDRLSSTDPACLDWHAWPAAYRDPESTEVAAFVATE